jgi:hypothetical protein
MKIEGIDVSKKLSFRASRSERDGDSRNLLFCFRHL